MKLLNRKARGIVPTGRNAEDAALPVWLVNTRLAFFENVLFAASIKIRHIQRFAEGG